MLKSIIIDAGHGGTDSGAVNGDIKEKNWNLIMSLYQYNRLRELGANVSITRKEDETLIPATRSNLVKNRYDYCISNHFNSATNENARGCQCIHSIFANSSIARKIADYILLYSNYEISVHSVYSRKGLYGKDYYFMHRNTGSTKTIIIEYGFLTNEKDRNFYDDEDKFFSVGEGVVKALCELTGVIYIPPTKQAKKMYSVQVASFENRESAAILLRQIKLDYPNAFIYEKEYEV